MKNFFVRLIGVWVLIFTVTVLISIYRDRTDIKSIVSILDYVSIGTMVLGGLIFRGANTGDDFIISEASSSVVDDKNSFRYAEFDNYLSGINTAWLFVIAGGTSGGLGAMIWFLS